MKISILDRKKGIIFTGALVGTLAVLLVYCGNPSNMGFCIACFIRDIAGALGLQQTATVQYLRPEIIGLGLGAFLMALGQKEFAARGGSSPVTRFVLGFLVMVGALMFLGCPLRMILRLSGGDLNALVGLVGFVLGIVIGLFFLKRGFSLKRHYPLARLEGYFFPLGLLGLLFLLLVCPAFFSFSLQGPGSLHAFVWLSLIIGVAVGGLAQRTRLCLVGGVRDWLLFKDAYLGLGFLSILLFASVANIFVGTYEVGFFNQPIAHADGLWNFLGMVLVGWGSLLLGGCPLRQVILAGEGNTDAVITLLGMLVGAACCHNFGLAASSAGPAVNGKIAVLLGLAIVFFIAYANTEELKFGRKGEVKVETN